MSRSKESQRFGREQQEVNHEKRYDRVADGKSDKNALTQPASIRLKPVSQDELSDVDQDETESEDCKDGLPTTARGREITQEDSEAIQDERNDETASDALGDVPPEILILEPTWQHSVILPARAVTTLYDCRSCLEVLTDKMCSTCSKPTQSIGWVETIKQYN